MRRRTDSHPNQVAHFLTQCLFCFFAEDVGLLPARMFERLVTNRKITADKLTLGLSDLFEAMGSGGMFGADEIPWFNGGLFKTVAVPALSILDVTELRKAAELNWSAIDVSIFGTLFERGLDPAKRSQLGAHYTDTATIDRLIEPVLRRPLLQRWQQVAQEIGALQARSAKKGDKNYRDAKARFIHWLDELKNYRVLDPACGSGNFLFLGLKALKDIEHRSHLDAAALGLDRESDLVTGPHNVLGIELNEYAAELARVTVWIGELQWRLAHGYEFKTNPVLEPLDHIECRDALLSFPVSVIEPGSLCEPGARAARTPEPHTLRFLKSAPTSAPPAPLSASGTGVEATWPKANVVIGSPPFLGDKKMRSELGDTYTEALRKTYQGRVPGGADLVCYWFEKARAAIERNGLLAAGLVATNSIRGGKNRAVLDAITKTTRIFDSWSDEGWVNDGAAVRVSLVAFGLSTQKAILDGREVQIVHADLTTDTNADASLDLTSAKPLLSNKASCFIGGKKKGSFDIPGPIARVWLRLPNPNGKSNAEVVKPWLNGLDVTRRPLDQWIVDFGIDMSEADAALYEAPFAHVLRAVQPQREIVRNELEKARWWLHARSAPDLRRATATLPHTIATARVAKYRLFVRLQPGVVVDGQLVVTARSDDTTFGILHSRFHELWSLRMGTSLEDRPRYTPTTCFETFPFPTGLTPADTAHQQTEQIEGGALIPANLSDNQQRKAGVVRMSGPISKSEAYEAPASEPAPPSGHQRKTSTRDAAIQIAIAAKKLNDLREAWLNPKEWTNKVPEVTPLGMSESPYPDRIEPKPGISQDDLKALQKRTLTNLYNLRPQWLVMAHQQLDLAVAQAYGWSDYSGDMPDEEILKRLLAINLQRSTTIE